MAEADRPRSRGGPVPSLRSASARRLCSRRSRSGSPTSAAGRLRCSGALRRSACSGNGRRWWRASDRRSVLMAGAVFLALALALAQTHHLVAAVIVLAMGALAAAALAPAERRIWIACGVPYAGAIGLAPIVLRADERGFLVIMLLFAIVWATDIAAYFAGRALGGPKLMPRVSPKKTWSGALAGTVAAVAGGGCHRQVRGPCRSCRDCRHGDLVVGRRAGRRSVRSPRSSAGSARRIRATSFPDTAA